MIMMVMMIIDYDVGGDDIDTNDRADEDCGDDIIIDSYRGGWVRVSIRVFSILMMMIACLKMMVMIVIMVVLRYIKTYP